MTDTYTLYYETPEEAVTLPRLSILDVVYELLWMQDNETLTHDDFLEILDSEGNHVHNSIEHIDSLVEFEVIDQIDVYPSDLVNALYALDYESIGVVVCYRLRGTQEWRVYND